MRCRPLPHTRTPYTSLFFFFNDTATTEIYTLSLHDALPISAPRLRPVVSRRSGGVRARQVRGRARSPRAAVEADRKSTRLNSSHDQISYAVFCLKKKKKPTTTSYVTTVRVHI